MSLLVSRFPGHSVTQDRERKVHSAPPRLYDLKIALAKFRQRILNVVDEDSVYLHSRTMLRLVIWRAAQHVWANGEGFGAETNPERITVTFFDCWLRSESINMCG